MKRASSPGGMFNGSDFRNAGGGHTALPGTGWLSRNPVPKPTPPPVAAKTPAPVPQPAPQPKPAQPQPAPAQPAAQPQQNTVSSFVTSPQFFGALAGAMRPVTHAVLGYGGLPALAGIYGMVSGNKDWSNAMQENPTALPPPKMPLPAKTANDRLVMPCITKQASDPFASAPPSQLQQHATWGLLGGAGGAALGAGVSMFQDKKKRNPWMHALTGGAIGAGLGVGASMLNKPDTGSVVNHANATNPGSSAGDTQTAGVAPAVAGSAGVQEAGAAGSPDVADSASSSVVPQIAQQVGTGVAAHVGLQRGLQAGATRVAPRLGIQAATKIPGLKGGFLWDTPINMVTDTLDGAGIYSIDGSKNQTGNQHFWRKPLQDEHGQLQRDEDGSVRTEAGWNPDAFGWDMGAHQKATTADGTVLGGNSTGNPWIDNPLGYGGAAFNAYSTPLKSTYSLGRFGAWEMNPLAQLATNSDERATLGNALSGKGTPTRDTSIPTTMVNTAVTKSWSPNNTFMPGGALHDSEAKRWKDIDRYHPVYNPEGQNSRPGYVTRMLKELLK